MTRFEKLIAIIVNPFWLRALVFHGVGASVESHIALKQAGCQTVVDIGANRGQFSLVAREVLPAARIIAFEPLPGPAQSYRRVFASDVGVTLHECAIGKTPGEAEMHISAKNDSSSLLPISETQTAIFPGTGEVGTAKVLVKTLASVLSGNDIQSPALLKLDVQGFELNALEGCDAVLGYFDYVYCECSFVELYRGQALADDVIAWLGERDFALRGVYNVTHDKNGKAVQADFLFSKRGPANNSIR